MPIPVTCSGCDRNMKVKDDFAGKKARCPYCQSVVVVPAFETDEPEVESYDVEEVVERERPVRSSRRRADPDEDEPRPRRGDRYEEEPRSRRRRDEEDDDDDRPRARSRDEDDDDDRPVRRKKKRKKSSSSGSGVNTGSIIGGLVMILIAVVWFVAGLAAGFIFFYPPVLLILGIIALVKGLAGQE